MSLRSSSQRLTPTTAVALKTFLTPLTSSSPLFPLLAPNAVSRRSIFGFNFGKKQVQPSDNPLTAEYLKQKPKGPPALIRGDLSSSSIFESDDAGPRTPQVRPDESRARAVRDPSLMAAVLDPVPENRKRWERKMVIRDIRRRGRLSRTQKIRRTERESLSKSHFIKTSVKKLGPLARQISGKSIEDAIVQMRFSKKKAAKEVKKHLEHARDEAIVKRGMALGAIEGTKGEQVEIELKDGKRKLVKDRTSLYIDQAWVGRGTDDKAPDHRARGQIHVMSLPYTSISVILKEEATRIRLSEEREKKRQNRKLWVHLPDRPITAQRQYYSW
ncbi:MAG: 54S ribosomal protein L22, mitochondrial [Pycnora praestabilis]|nr:MAG: 54S ribosomal protein L22, mitochondrial [Pycnora praestabilis]